MIRSDSCNFNNSDEINHIFSEFSTPSLLLLEARMYAIKQLIDNGTYAINFDSNWVLIIIINILSDIF